MNEEQLAHANEVMAKECGVTIIDNGGFVMPYLGETCLFLWTIEDARCREIVREKFKIDTNYDRYAELWESCTCDKDCYPIIISTGKGIEDAEINCILQIAEQIEG